jgi:uncharacterized protein (PEP-CTERM system associated)
MGIFSMSPPWPLRQLVVSLAAAWVTVAAQAQLVRVQPSIAANVVVTDNANFTEASQARKDVYVEFSPRLDVALRGARNRFSLNGGFDAVRYWKNSDPTHVYPVANAELTSTLIDQSLFLDASARLDRRAASPYAAQAVGVTADGQVNSAIYRLNPHLRLAMPSGWQGTVRSDHVLTQRSNGPLATDKRALTGSAYAEDTQVHLERLPQSLGAGLDLQHQRLRYLHSYDGNMLGLDAARLSMAYALNPEFTATVLGGIERNTFDHSTRSDSDVGLRLRWVPMPRSEWSIEGRRRFFGNGFNASWVHNAAFWSTAVSASREPVTQAGTVRLAPIDGDLAGYFDDAFRSAGYADAAQRAQRVRDTLEALGLSAEQTEAINVYTLYPQLSTGGNAALVFTGRRNTLAFNVFARQLEKLKRKGEESTDDILASLGSLRGDLRQYGALVGWELKVTPLTSLNAALSGYQTRSLTIATDCSTDGSATLAMTHRLAARTRAGVRLEHHRFSSTVRPSAQANSVGVLLSHSF